jgi:cyclic-di-AMP phosphodiesterase PgpH
VKDSPESSSSFFTFIKNLSKFNKVVLIISFLLSFIIIFTYFISYQSFIKEGDIALKDINSPITTRYINKTETEKLKKQAEDKVPLIYQKNIAVNNTVINDIEYFFEKLKTERNNKLKTDNEKIVEINKLLLNNQKYQNYSEFLITTDERNIELLKKITISFSKKLLDKGVQEEDLQEIFSDAKNLISLTEKRENIVNISATLISIKMKPNFMIDEEETKKSKEIARESIVPVINTIIKNEKVVIKGQKIDENALEKLKTLGIIKSPFNWEIWLKSLAYPFLCYLCILIYLYFSKYKKIFDRKNFLFLNILLVSVVLSVRYISSFSPYLIPIFIFSTLLCLFFESKLAIFVYTVIFSMSLLVFGIELPIIIAYLISGLVSIIMFTKLTTASDLFKNGLISSIFFTFSMMTFIFFSEESFLYSNKVYIMSLTFVNGIFASLFALGIIFALERFAGFVTPLKMFELSDPGSPLLRKLFEYTPGTYQHSIFVANLSSHAAESIGCDSLLARLGAYYHDIGKISNPLSFTENSQGSNILDKLPLDEALLIIKSHVKEGLKIADDFKLPNEIKEIIAEHQGTSKICFLYNAYKKSGLNNIDASSFRYDGPKPRSKESVIVFLADSLEASIRSIDNKNNDIIKEQIDKIVDEKIKDSQLDKSEITFKELNIIKQSFYKTILSLYHIRIPYPADIETA